MKTSRKAFAAAMVVAALAVPAAGQARPMGADGPIDTRIPIPYLSHGVGVDPVIWGGSGVPAAAATAPGGSGLHWSDVGIGAGIATGAMAAAAATGLAFARARRRHASNPARLAA
jgi:hypothetical protein